MADTLKNSGLNVTTSFTSAYTCPVGTQASIHTFNLSNIDPVNNTVVGARIFDASGAVNFVLFANIPLIPGSAFVYDKSINLEPGDRLEVISDINSVCQAFISVIERT